MICDYIIFVLSFFLGTWKWSCHAGHNSALRTFPLGILEGMQATRAESWGLGNLEHRDDTWLEGQAKRRTKKYYVNIQWKFRSQTSDQMDRWKITAMEKVRREKIRDGEDQRVRKSEDRRCRYAKRSEFCEALFFQWFVAPEVRKVGSLKRRVRRQLDRWEMNTCTLLWHEAHQEVTNVKNGRSRSFFGSWDMESARRCGAKHTWKSNCRKHLSSGRL